MGRRILDPDQKCPFVVVSGQRKASCDGAAGAARHNWLLGG